MPICVRCTNCNFFPRLITKISSVQNITQIAFFYLVNCRHNFTAQIYQFINFFVYFFFQINNLCNCVPQLVTAAATLHNVAFPSTGNVQYKFIQLCQFFQLIVDRPVTVLNLSQVFFRCHSFTLASNVLMILRFATILSGKSDARHASRITTDFPRDSTLSIAHCRKYSL